MTQSGDFFILGGPDPPPYSIQATSNKEIISVYLTLKVSPPTLTMKSLVRTMVDILKLCKLPKKRRLILLLAVCAIKPSIMSRTNTSATLKLKGSVKMEYSRVTDLMITPVTISNQRWIKESDPDQLAVLVNGHLTRMISESKDTIDGIEFLLSRQGGALMNMIGVDLSSGLSGGIILPDDSDNSDEDLDDDQDEPPPVSEWIIRY